MYFLKNTSFGAYIDMKLCAWNLQEEMILKRDAMDTENQADLVIYRL